MAKKGPSFGPTARVQALVDEEVALRMGEALTALKRDHVNVSVSMFVEIALRELLGPEDEPFDDLPEIMRRYEATPRRDRVKKKRR